MSKVIKLRKGLDIRLTGEATRQKETLGQAEEYGVTPHAFRGLVPKVIVREGDHVEVGDALFVNKACPDVRFASPISGVVTGVVRGERRKVLCVKVKADVKQAFHDFGVRELSKLDGEGVKKALLEAGLFGYIDQLPYAISTTPETSPKAIFVSALRDMPLAGDFEFELDGQEAEFQAGLTALSKIAHVYLGVGKHQTAESLLAAQNVEVIVFDGPCPAGNVGVQVNHVSPVNKGEVVWTVDPTAVIFFGRLFTTGRVNLTRTVAIAGSEINHPKYVDCLIGTPLSLVLGDKLKSQEHVRVIDGNPLTGHRVTLQDYIGGHTSEIVAIPEGDNVHEMLGWMLPRTSQFSVHHSYFSWLLGKKAYTLDARVKGGERHMIMSGEYDKVLPMDIYAEYLVKAIIAGDIDRQEQLGIYEVSPEDFALAEFVDSSKLPLQKIIRDGLDVLRKENA